MNYISLNLESYNKTTKEYSFNNKFGPNPLIKNNTLYLPEEILNGIFIANYKSSSQSNKDNNNIILKKSQEQLLFQNLTKK